MQINKDRVVLTVSLYDYDPRSGRLHTVPAFKRIIEQVNLGSETIDVFPAEISRRIGLTRAAIAPRQQLYHMWEGTEVLWT